MEPMHEQSIDEHNPLLASTQDDHSPAKTTPENSPGSFSTLLQNVQCFNLVSVSVNVSTNHDEGKHEEKDDRPRASSRPTAENEWRQRSNQNAVQDGRSNSGLLGSFSTLLRSFQIFNLVSVLVNVSTNHEVERTPKSSKKEGKKIIPDYYQNVFGKDATNEDEASPKELANSKGTTNYLAPSKIPVLFRIQNSDHIEAFTVCTATTYTDIISTIAELSESSPSCKPSSTERMSTTPETTELSLITSPTVKARVKEIDIDWDIGEGRDWPKTTRLTEENCEAVLLLMERGMMGVLDVRIEKEHIEDEKAGKEQTHGEKIGKIDDDKEVWWKNGDKP